MPGTTCGTGGQRLQRPHQAYRLSCGISRRVALRILRSGAGAAVAALGCAGLGTRQTLDRQRVGHRLQLATTDGELGGPVTPFLAAWGDGALDAAGEEVCGAARVHPV